MGHHVAALNQLKYKAIGIDLSKAMVNKAKQNYPDSNYSSFDTEFNDIISALNKIGVMVFLAPQKYFPIGHRGVYHTVGNNFFLNETA